MKKQWKVILSIFAVLLVMAVIVPQNATAATGYKRVNLDSITNMWDNNQKAWVPTARVKYGKKYYWATTDGVDYDNGSGCAIYKINYYCSTSKTGKGTKLFSNYEMYAGSQDNTEFFTNGTYIIKSAASKSSPNMYVYRYNMKGKSKKTLQTFKAGSSSNDKGSSSYCEANIVNIYGGKVYVSYFASGFNQKVKIVSFPVSKKKAYKKVSDTANYFSSCSGKYLGLGSSSGTYIYDLKTGKKLKISSAAAKYLGKYNSKEYYYTYSDSKAIIYSANSAWKKRTKVFTIKSATYPFIKGKYIYYDFWDSSKEEYRTFYKYDIAKKTKTKITEEEYIKAYSSYYNRKPIKDTYYQN